MAEAVRGKSSAVLAREEWIMISAAVRNAFGAVDPDEPLRERGEMQDIATDGRRRAVRCDIADVHGGQIGPRRFASEGKDRDRRRTGGQVLAQEPARGEIERRGARRRGTEEPLKVDGQQMFCGKEQGMPAPRSTAVASCTLGHAATSPFSKATASVICTSSWLAAHAVVAAWPRSNASWT